MKKIYLVRHAQASGQSFDAPLTKEGERDSLRLVDFFHGITIDAIISSPYKRAIDTVTPLANHLGKEIFVDQRLSERVLSNQSLENWKDRLKESFDNFHLCLEGGESNAYGLKRASSLYSDLLQSEKSNFLLCSHGNLSTLFLRLFDSNYGYEQLLQMTNPDVFEITISENEKSVKRIWEE
jgi:2,3-bisphosphoglycerate-dependent phosphoglycerate mutase